MYVKINKNKIVALNIANNLKTLKQLSLKKMDSNFS